MYCKGYEIWQSNKSGYSPYLKEILVTFSVKRVHEYIHENIKYTKYEPDFYYFVKYFEDGYRVTSMYIPSKFEYP